MKLWQRVLAYFVLGYAGLTAMLLFLENKLVYHPSSAEQSWTAAPTDEFQDVALTCADGTRMHAWFLPCRDSEEALLYCHGNGGNLSQRGASMLKLRELLQVNVLIIDYPGYGKSEGEPSERGCYQAADAAHAWLVDEKKFLPKNILLYGVSLGGGVVTELASRKEQRALILIKTFTSLPDVAAELYWWLPVPKRVLMRNRFDSLSRIADCPGPIFIAHGTDDELVPFAHGERLYEAARAPKRFLPLRGDGHNDPLPEVFFVALKEFLEKNRK